MLNSVFAALLAVAAPVLCVDEPPSVPATAAPASAPSASIEVTRADLAAAYLRFEKAWRANPPRVARIAKANNEFDQATLAFFGGSYGSAIATINRLSASLRPKSRRGAASQIAESLKVRMLPRVVVADSARPATASIASLYEIEFETEQAVALELCLVDSAGAVAVRKPLNIAAGPVTRVNEQLTMTESGKTPPVGAYRVQLAGAGVQLDCGWFFVVRQPLSQTRETNARRLDDVKPASPAMEQALATCRARNALLVDEASETNSAQFLADPVELAPAIDKEITQLLAGIDPYRRRVGDYWRVLRLGMVDIPLRVYAPPTAGGDSALPLVIVLHGAGGDENMFMDGYGAGRIKELAMERGMLVASPLTYSFGGNPKSVDRLIQALGFDYEIDTTRVYVIGHSMGAGVAAGLSRTNANVLAAVCCMAGAGRFMGKQRIAPTMVIAGAQDPLTRGATMAERMVEAAREAGQPVEIKVLKEYGHTLMVGDELPAVVDWLLKHRRQVTATMPEK